MTQPADLENDTIDLSGTEAPDVQDELTPDVTPEPDTTPEPEPEQAAPTPTTDPMAAISALAESQRQQIEWQRQQAEEQRRVEQLRQAEANRPKPLMEQEAWKAEWDEVNEQAPYNLDARRRRDAMQQEWMREQVQAQMAPMQEQIRLEMRSEAILRETTALARQQWGDAVNEQTFTDVAMGLFQGNRAAIAQALDPQNPQSQQNREYLTDLVLGRRLRLREIEAPTRAVPPPNPRSAARSATPAKPTPSNNEVYDDEYTNAVINDAINRRRA